MTINSIQKKYMVTGRDRGRPRVVGAAVVFGKKTEGILHDRDMIGSEYKKEKLWK